MYDNLYYIGGFKKFAIKINKDALFEYERLKQNDLFSTIKWNTVTAFVHNARSLSKCIDDIVRDDRITNNGILGFEQTQINP